MSKLNIKIKGISLRPRKDSDEKFLRIAYESSRDVELEAVLWENDAQREHFLKFQYDAQQLHFDTFYKNMDYDIIELHGEPIGRLCLVWEADHLECNDIILLTKYRKQKFGTRIMDAITKEVDKRGITASLMYEKHKPYLEAFYERYGFKTTKEYPTHFYMQRPKKN